MYVYRQSYWLIVLLALTGCFGLDPMAQMFDRSGFSHAAQREGNAQCAALYGNGQFRRLGEKMPILPGALPSAEMLTLNLAPDPQDIQAIQALEGAVRTCRRMREAAGMPTSASEDILNERISRLRLGLYRGDLPYAVYNYGVAQALKSHNRFMLEAEQTAARGRTVGEERANGLMLGQLLALSTMLSAYDRATAQAQRPPNWTCTTSAYPSGNTVVDCY